MFVFLSQSPVYLCALHEQVSSVTNQQPAPPHPHITLPPRHQYPMTSSPASTTQAPPPPSFQIQHQYSVGNSNSGRQRPDPPTLTMPPPPPLDGGGSSSNHTQLQQHQQVWGTVGGNHNHPSVLSPLSPPPTPQVLLS